MRIRENPPFLFCTVGLNFADLAVPSKGYVVSSSGLHIRIFWLACPLFLVLEDLSLWFVFLERSFSFLNFKLSQLLLSWSGRNRKVFMGVFCRYFVVILRILLATFCEEEGCTLLFLHKMCLLSRLRSFWFEEVSLALRFVQGVARDVFLHLLFVCFRDPF